MHGYIPKDKLKRDESTGQTEDKKIANNYADVINQIHKSLTRALFQLRSHNGRISDRKCWLMQCWIVAA